MYMRRERLVEAAMTRRKVGDGSFVEAWTLSVLLLGERVIEFGVRSGGREHDVLRRAALLSFIWLHKKTRNIHTRQPKQRIRLRTKTNSNLRIFRHIINLRLPVIHFILLWHGQIRLHRAYRVEKLYLGTTHDKAVCDL
jgi:predicted LPLAT superfamily acyltransferase